MYLSKLRVFIISTFMSKSGIIGSYGNSSSNFFTFFYLDASTIKDSTAAATAAKSLQSCPTLCDPIDGSPPGFPVPGILQARTLVGCHFLLQCMKVKSESEVASVVSDPSRPHGLQPTRLLHPWDFQGKSTGVGCHFLLQKTVLHCLY